MANTPATGDILARLTRLHQRQNSLHDLVNERHDSLRDLVTTLHNATQTALRRHGEPERIDAQPQGYADTLSINVTFGGRRILRRNDLLDAPQDTSGISGLGTRVRRNGSASQEPQINSPMRTISMISLSSMSVRTIKIRRDRRMAKAKDALQAIRIPMWMNPTLGIQLTQRRKTQATMSLILVECG